MKTFIEARDCLLEHREDLHGAREAFEWPELGAFNWAFDWFDAVLAKGAGGDRVALEIVGEHAARLTFAELSERSNRVANGLRDLGVTPGDRILLMLGNEPALWEIMLAAMKIGAVVLPASTLLSADDLRARIDDGGVNLWITDPDLAETFGGLGQGVKRIVVRGQRSGWTNYADLETGSRDFEAGPPASADNPILLYFTSGTTSKPKLVMHSHRSYGLGSLTTMYWLGLQPGDVHLNISSPGWAKHAWSCLFAPWNAGATVFVANLGRFNARNLLDVLSQYRVTSLCAPPTVWRMLVQEDLGAWPTWLTSVCGAGEPLNPEVIGVVKKAWGLIIRDGYGQTETTALLANTPGQTVRPGAVGRPLPGYDIVLVNADGEEVGEGEIAVRLSPRPAGVMTGYEHEGQVHPVQGELYRTGDVAVRDADGWFTFVGRADDVFKSADYRISPFELESAIIEHPAVAEAAIVPAPDATRLNVPKAYVQLAPGYEPTAETAQNILAHARATLSAYKRIRRIEFFELPKTVSGKIRRVELRARELARARTDARDGEYREDDFPDLAG